MKGSVQFEYTKDGPLHWHWRNTKLRAWMNFATIEEAIEDCWASGVLLDKSPPSRIAFWATP